MRWLVRVAVGTPNFAKCGRASCLILLDPMMPVMTGYEFLAELRGRDADIRIASELLPRMFDRFVRGGAQVDATRHSPAGLGIGLAVVEELIVLHGGTVSVQSSGIGKGSNSPCVCRRSKEPV
jgi:hypothetical protein